jgi:hypothetical protein
MKVELAFFHGDSLLCRTQITCGAEERTEVFSGADSHEFTVTHRFEEPACPVVIDCTRSGERLYRAALRMGVHTGRAHLNST